MTEQEFNTLIDRYQQGLATEKEKQMLESWLAQRNQVDLLSLSAEDKEKKRLSILARIEAKRSVPVPVNTFGSVWRVAAAVLLLATVSYFGWQYAGSDFGSQAELMTATSAGDINKVMLADGSIVWLKGNSTLTFPAQFTGNTRNVTLMGEALFEVEKDPSHPFVIQCGELTTTVLGTSFNIKSSAQNIEVVVLTGKVSLTSAYDKQGIIVLPNEKAIYRGRNLAKAETPKEEKMAAVTGTQYSMDFNDTRMNEIIRRIEGKFNVKVSMTDPSLGTCMITADLTDKSLQRTLDIITRTLTVQYEINGNTITLKGKACN